MKARPSVVTWAISTRDSVPVPERPQAAICSTSRPRVYNAARRRTCPECVSWSCDCPCVFQHRPWTRSRQILAQSNQPSPAESSFPRPKPTNDQIPHRGRNNAPRPLSTDQVDRSSRRRKSQPGDTPSVSSVRVFATQVEPPRSPSTPPHSALAAARFRFRWPSNPTRSHTMQPPSSYKMLARAREDRGIPSFAMNAPFRPRFSPASWSISSGTPT